MTFCEGGAEFVTSARGQELIEKIAREKRKPGHARFFYKRKPVCTGLVVTRSTPNKTDAITEIIRSFPGRIARHDALSRIQCGLEDARMSFDPRRDKDKLVIARKAAGFSAPSLVWERTA